MDLIYAPYRGVVWTADTAVPLADAAELSFSVGDDLELHFYERIRNPATWSEHIEKQAEKEHRKIAARPTPEWMKPSP